MANQDFAKCLYVERHNADAVLDCATQTLDMYGVPRK
jgi:hypothetical protein